MQTLLVLFSALSVFGIGVTIVDMFGVFEQSGQEADASGDESAADDGDASEGDSADGDSADSAGLIEAGDGEAGSDTDNDGDSGDTNDAGADTAADSSHGQSLLSYDQHGHTHPSRSPRSAGARGTKAVAKTLGFLRSTVYFSLGAGPTGLFGLLSGQGIGSSLAWSAGAGVAITVMAKLLRRFMRRDLDSSIHPEEYLMDMAAISVPVLPGQMGKALVRRYDREVELYVKAPSPLQMYPKGTSVRIVDMNEDVYFVEEE